MTSSVKHSIFQNGLASLFSKTVRIADQLFLVPFFLTIWGKAYYGEWLTLSAFPSILALADLGLGTAAGNAFVLNYVAGKKQDSADYFKTGLFLISISAIFGILITVAIMFVLQKNGILEKSLLDSQDAFLAVIFLMSSRLVSFYNQLFDGLYRSEHHAAFSINFMTVEGLCRIGAGFCVLLLGYGIVMFSFCQMIIVFLFNLVYALIGRCIPKELPHGRYNKCFAQEIAKKGFAYLASPVWQGIYYQGSTFAVRIALGAEVVALFNTARALCRSVNQAFMVVENSIFPNLQQAIGEGKIDLTKRIFIKAVQLVFIFSFIGIIFLLFFGKPIYNWWTRSMLDIPDSIWYLLLLGILFNSIWWTAGTVFRAANQPYLFAIYSLVSASVSVVLSYILAYPFGLLGATIGYITMDILMAITILPEACKIIGLNMQSLLIFKSINPRHIF